MELTKKVAKRVQELLPDMEVEPREISKNNGVVRQAVSVRKLSDPVAQVIYIDEMLDGWHSVYEMASYVVDTYRQNQKPVLTDGVLRIKKYAEARKLLSLRLINKKMNREKLSNAPYKDFLDMAVIAILAFPSNDDVVVSSVVDHSMLEAWDVPFDLVYADAYKNFMEEKTVIMDMNDVLSQAGIKTLLSDDGLYMHILTNEKGIYGATHLLKKDILEQFMKEWHSDIWVLPSSVHEVILVPCPDNMDIDINEMTQMVRSVNQEQVPLEEVLSDHAYLYKLNGGWSNREEGESLY